MVRRYSRKTSVSWKCEISWFPLFIIPLQDQIMEDGTDQQKGKNYDISHISEQIEKEDTEDSDDTEISDPVTPGK